MSSKSSVLKSPVDRAALGCACFGVTAACRRRCCAWRHRGVPGAPSVVRTSYHRTGISVSAGCRRGVDAGPEFVLYRGVPLDHGTWLRSTAASTAASDGGLSQRHARSNQRPITTTRTNVSSSQRRTRPRRAVRAVRPHHTTPFHTNFNSDFTAVESPNSTSHQVRPFWVLGRIRAARRSHARDPRTHEIASHCDEVGSLLVSAHPPDAQKV